jgi:hypothetical protein
MSRSVQNILKSAQNPYPETKENRNQEILSNPKERQKIHFRQKHHVMVRLTRHNVRKIYRLHINMLVSTSPTLQIFHIFLCPNPSTENLSIDGKAHPLNDNESRRG